MKYFLDENILLELEKFVLVYNKYPSADTLLKRIKGKKKIVMVLEKVKEQYPIFIEFLPMIKEKMLSKDFSFCEIVDVLVHSNKRISRYEVNGFRVREGSKVIVDYFHKEEEAIVVGKPYYVDKNYVSYEYKKIKKVIGSESLKEFSISEIQEFVSSYLLIHKSFDQINETKEYALSKNKNDFLDVMKKIRIDYSDLEAYISFYKVQNKKKFLKDATNYLLVADIYKEYANRVTLKPYILSDEELKKGDAVITFEYEEKGIIISNPYYILKKYADDLVEVQKALYGNDEKRLFHYRLKILGSIDSNLFLKQFKGNFCLIERKLIELFEEMFHFYNKFYGIDEECKIISFSNVYFDLKENIKIEVSFFTSCKFENEDIILDDVSSMLEQIEIIENSSEITIL